MPEPSRRPRAGSLTGVTVPSTSSWRGCSGFGRMTICWTSPAGQGPSWPSMLRTSASWPVSTRQTSRSSTPGATSRGASRPAAPRSSRATPGRCPGRTGVSALSPAWARSVSSRTRALPGRDVSRPPSRRPGRAQHRVAGPGRNEAPSVSRRGPLGVGRAHVRRMVEEAGFTDVEISMPGRPVMTVLPTSPGGSSGSSASCTAPGDRKPSPSLWGGGRHPVVPGRVSRVTRRDGRSAGTDASGKRRSGHVDETRRRVDDRCVDDYGGALTFKQRRGVTRVSTAGTAGPGLASRIGFRLMSWTLAVSRRGPQLEQRLRARA